MENLSANRFSLSRATAQRLKFLQNHRKFPKPEGGWGEKLVREAAFQGGREGVVEHGALSGSVVAAVHESRALYLPVVERGDFTILIPKISM